MFRKVEGKAVWRYTNTRGPDWVWGGQQSSREAAIEAGRKLYGTDTTFWIAEGQQVPVERLLAGTTTVVLDYLRDTLDEWYVDGVFGPCASFEFPAPYEETTQALDTLLLHWAQRFLQDRLWVQVDLLEAVYPSKEYTQLSLPFSEKSVGA